MSLEPYSVELDPDSNTTLKAFLFKNVQNVEEIINNIIKGVWKCAVVKPSLILDPFQLAVAANRAVVAAKHNSMVTRTVFAEILFNLSLSKNISQSLSKFGIEKDKELLVCFVVSPECDPSNDIIPQIEGEPSPISELKNMTNLQELKKVYKISNSETDILDLVVSKMVTKSFVAH